MNTNTIDAFMSEVGRVPGLLDAELTSSAFSLDAASDIDIRVQVENLSAAIDWSEARGYELLGVEPTAVTMKRGPFNLRLSL